MVAIQVLFFLAALGFLIFSIIKLILSEKKNLTSLLPGVILFLLVTLVINPSFGQVPAGYRGVVLQFGAVTGEVKNEGLYFVTPFINSIQLMNVQVHADKSKATAASRDLQNVTTEVTVNYRLDSRRAAEVYRDLRDEYVDRVMIPAIQEAIKSATAQFDAENLIRERPLVKDTIEKYLQNRLIKHGLIVDGIAITNFEFSADFANAIEAKVTATQLAMAAENKLREVKAQAQQQIETAKAGAEAIRIQANAINAQGGRDYVSLKAIEKWDGTVPQWVGSGSAIPFINMTPPQKQVASQ